MDFNHGLNAAVNKLRDALCDSADDPRYIETLPRRGYRFIAEVEKAIASRADEFAKAAGRALSESAAQVAPDTTVLPVRAAADLAEAESVPVLVSAQTQSSRRTLPWLRYSILGVVLILGLWGLWSHVGPRVAGHLHGVMTATEGAGPSTLTPLTSLADRTGNPAFSPDGRQVAFRRQSFVPGNSGIWVKQVGEEGLLQLTNGDTDCCPVWSPDGHSVAFSRLSDKQRTIYEVPVKGGAVRVLSVAGMVSGHAEIDWSPDGDKIAFAAKGAQNPSAIFLLSLDSRTVRQITGPHAKDEDWGPAFSPDGSRIAFVRSSNIMVMPAEGGELQRLTPESVSVLGSPAWAPDGQSIVFASIIFASGHQDRVGLWRIPAVSYTHLHHRRPHHEPQHGCCHQRRFDERYPALHRDRQKRWTPDHRRRA